MADGPERVSWFLTSLSRQGFFLKYNTAEFQWFRTFKNAVFNPVFCPKNLLKCLINSILHYLLNKKILSNILLTDARFQVEGSPATSEEPTKKVQQVTVVTHRQGKVYKGPHFFILNKGLNSGKPLLDPCPNCFVLITHDQSQKEFYYWLSFGLWKSKTYYPFLRGSVIEFITIKDLKNVLTGEAKFAIQKMEGFKKAVLMLNKIEHYEKHIKKTLSTLATSKIQIFRSYKNL
jgi:hypothetical protein